MLCGQEAAFQGGTGPPGLPAFSLRQTLVQDTLALPPGPKQEEHTTPLFSRWTNPHVTSAPDSQLIHDFIPFPLKSQAAARPSLRLAERSGMTSPPPPSSPTPRAGDTFSPQGFSSVALPQGVGVWLAAAALPLSPEPEGGPGTVTQQVAAALVQGSALNKEFAGKSGGQVSQLTKRSCSSSAPSRHSVTWPSVRL